MGLEVFNPFAGLLGEKPRQDSWRWGTVVATDPLRVQLDGDSTPLTIPPDSLTALIIGDRVRVHTHNKRVTVIGKTTNDDAAHVWIGGQKYPRGGVITGVKVPSFDGSSPVFWAIVTLTPPVTPPPGWYINYFGTAANPGRVYTVARRSNTLILIIQMGHNATDASYNIGWQLMPDNNATL